jgi:1,2-diacylglycerol 3-alpha-glucosyltransferase
MNIALFTDTYKPDINGVVSSIHTLRLALEDQGHTVYVVTTNQSVTRTSFEDNVLRLPGMELRGLYGYRMSSPIHLATMNNEIKKMNLDVIHVHTEFGIGLFARICSRLLSIPLVSTYHTTYEDYTHYVNRLDIDFVDDMAKNAVSRLSKVYVDSGQCVIAPSIKTKEMLERYKIKSKIFVIPTGLDLQKFDKSNTTDQRIQEIRKECGITNQKILLFLGRIAPEKSVDILIETMTYIKRDNINIKLVIVGDGPALNSLKKLVDKKNLEDYVYFTGSKISSQVPSYYHAADMFASASTTETQGMTYIESLAASTIVFANDPDVVEDLVIEDETGYLFSDSKSLYEKLIHHISKDDSRIEQMNYDTLEVTKLYDSRLFGKKVLKVYNTAIFNYEGLLVIDKIRLKNDYVELFLESENISTKVAVSTEDYYNLGLRKDNPITNVEYNYLVNRQDEILAYDSCIRKIAIKDRSKKEIIDYINKKFDIEEKQVQCIVEKLQEKKLIDDYKYAEDQVYYLSTLLNSYRSIKGKLLKKGISDKIIADVMEEKNDYQEYENALQIANKYVKTVRNVSVKMKKQKVKQKLYRNGFSMDTINEVIENMDFVYDELQQNKILKELYKNAYKRYSKKFKSHELRNKIYQYLVSKGFDNDRVYLIMSESEWNEDED